MQLLERAADFYAALVNELSQNDPKIIQFRLYMIQQFGGQGQAETKRIDQAFRDGNIVQPRATIKAGKVVQQGKESEAAYADGFGPDTANIAPKYQKFKHPNFQKAGKIQSLKKWRGSGDRVKGRFQDVGDQVEEVDTPLTSPKASTKAATTAKASAKAAAAADKKVKPITSKQVEDFLEMQPTQIAQSVTKEQITAYLEKQDIPYNPDASHRQLAATLLGNLKKKA